MWYIVEGDFAYGPLQTKLEACLAVKYLCNSRGGSARDYPIVTKDKIKETRAAYHQAIARAKASI